MTTSSSAIQNLAGGGEMGRLIRDFDWSTTPLGPLTAWPQSLLTAISICLASRFPIILWWGPELVVLYNDAYIPIFGNKHPHSLGQPGLSPRAWGEVKDIIGPMLHGVLERGEATWEDDQLLVLERNGFPEEAYFTYSYSPIRDESGNVGGVFAAVSETTARVFSERRLRALRELAERSAHKSLTPAATCATAAEILARNPSDVPFCQFYLVDGQADGAGRLLLAGEAGLPDGHPLGLSVVDAAYPHPWLLLDALDSPGRTEVTPPSGMQLPGGRWPEPSSRAIVMPIRASGKNRAVGVFVAGVSPRLAFNDDYRGFFDLVANQIETSVSNALAFQEATARAEALAAIDRAKTAFFSNVSHEFRTPLTLMLGPLEDSLADAANPLPRAHRERIELIRRNSVRLLKLVNTLLDFSRIEAGRTKASFAPTDLAALTKDLAGSFRSAIEHAGLTFSVDCQAVDQVFIDPDMWEKIVLNLLSNAFKFTFSGGITVSIRRAGNRVELTVSDTGTGIPHDELPKLFDRFHRVQGARSRTHEGSGIGLALVQDLVRLHGGDIRVVSEVDHGTSFTISVPLGSDHLPPDQITTAKSRQSDRISRSAFIQEALTWTPASEAEPVHAGAEPSPGHSVLESSANAPRERILLADDNADMREYVQRLLSRHWDVDVVGDGIEALAHARRKAPDVVLSDVMMPRLDGFGLLREIRADAALKQVPVILLSARAGEEASIEGLEAGADDYLIKPFSARELLARVGSHLTIARLRKRLEANRRFLDSARLALSASLNPHAQLRSLADLCVPAVADWCIIDLVDESRTRRALCIIARDGNLAAMAQQIRQDFPPSADDPLVKMVSTGAVGIIEDLNTVISATNTDPTYSRRMHDLGVRSTMVIPVQTHGRMYATIILAMSKEGRPFDESDRAFGMELSRFASLTIENALLYKEMAEARQEAETLNAVGFSVASELELEKVVQIITDGGTKATGAQFGAFFYNVVDQHGARYTLYTISGVPRERFTSFPMPRATALFGPTFRGEGIIRLADVRADPRYGRAAPHHGLPPGHLPVVSYLAVPVKSRSGDVLGGLFFGHPEPGRFDLRHERLVSGMAAQAAIAIDNATLFKKEKHARQSAAERASELGRMNAELEQFAYISSHDLQEPLRTITQYLELLESRYQGKLDDKGQRYVTYARAGATRMYGLINDLLSFSRAGRETANMQPVGLSAIIAEIRADLASNIARTGATIHADGLPEVVCDPLLTKQVLQNLIANSLKFVVGKPPEITVSVADHDEHWNIAIADNGIGIDPANNSRLFQVFQRLHRQDEFPGTGIGLAICQKLVEKQGGRITVASAAGAGAIFSFSIPKPPVTSRTL